MILRHLADNRTLQATFANLIGATQFKTVEDNILMKTKCPKCKKPNTWEHHLKCYNLQTPQITQTKLWLESIKGYITTIATPQLAKLEASQSEYYS